MYQSQCQVKSTTKLEKYKRIKRMRQNYQLYLLILPALIYFLIFHYLPMYGIQLAFKEFIATKTIWGSPWIGFANFRDFFRSYYFSRLIGNTTGISIYQIIAGFPFPIILALMLNEIGSNKYKKIVQTVTYAPHFISTVVMVGMIFLFLNPTYGIVNIFIKSLGFKAIDLINKPEAFKSIYVWSNIWQSTGWGSIIYFATLASVDPEQHEAATIDGASRLQRVWHINIPVIIPVATIMLILNMGSIMSVGFEKAFLMQTDLNISKSDVISTYTYRVGLINSRFSFASAVGLFNSVINCFLLIVFNKIANIVTSTSLW